MKKAWKIIGALAAIASVGTVAGIALRGEKQVASAHPKDPAGSSEQAQAGAEEKRYVCREDLVEANENDLAYQHAARGDAEVVDCLGVGCGTMF